MLNGEKEIDWLYIGEFNNWKCTFENLPEFKVDGKKIEYTLEEAIEEVYAGEFGYENNFENEDGFKLYQEHYIKQINGTTITNRYIDDPDERIKVTGKKVWEDDDNKALKRPESVVLQIKNGNKVVSEAVATEATNWSYEFEVAKYDEKGNEIEYHIDEKETPKFYEKEILDDFTVKNKFVVPDEKAKIEVIKLWEDLDNKYEKRPKSITLQVYNKNELVAEQIVNEDVNWRHEFKLSKYDELGNEIEYRIDEKEEVKCYEKRVSGYTVINKCIYEPTTDTSDINVFSYIVVSFIAIIGIIVGLNIFKTQKRIVK